jgi:hypothetical protein
MTSRQMIEAFEKETGQDWDSPETVQQEMNRLLWSKAWSASWSACLDSTLGTLEERQAEQAELRASRWRGMYTDRRA